MNRSTLTTHEKTDKFAWSWTWIITAAWAHPAWYQYELALYDLTSNTGAPLKIYLEGATHEFLLSALDPNHKIDHDKPLLEQQVHRLEPANHCYQFKAVSNEAAWSRMQLIVDDIDNMRLNPDTDFRQLWDSRFSDAYSLKL